MAFSKESAFEFLRRASGQGRLAHAYLITGPHGSGKRALAAQLAALVNNLPSGEDPLKHPDVHTAEPESKSRRILIEQVRALEKELQMCSTRGGKKVGMIFEADRLMIQASNAFLKTLEEPPSNSLLLLTSALPELLPETILSRCISVPLNAVETEPSALEKQLLEVLSDFFRQWTGAIPQVFGLVRRFVQLLQSARQVIQEEIDTDLKREQALYKQTTDGKWLEDRENYYKALSESRYIHQRFCLVDTLIQWWADVLRHQQDYAQLDLPARAADTAGIAKRLSVSNVLQRIDHLDQLRMNFNRNVQELLAIEVAFLGAFGETSGSPFQSTNHSLL